MTLNYPVSFHSTCLFLALMAATVAKLQPCLAATATMATASTTTKPGCPRQCGNVTIPYPFGIGDSSCFLNSYYNLFCSNNSTLLLSYTDYVHTIGFEILDISETGMRIRNPHVAFVCFNPRNKTTAKNDSYYSMQLAPGSPFTFSPTSNKLVVIGCLEIGHVYSVTSFGEADNSCSSVCPRKEDVVAGQCKRSGCCEAPVPSGSTTIEVKLDYKSNNTDVSWFDPCGYAFLAEVGTFTFGGLSDLSDPYPKFISRVTETVPVVMDWVIGNGTCKDAQRDGSTYACMGNTTCSDGDQFESGGYKCFCQSGFQGNPYLSPGCTDINECEEEKLNVCERPEYCVNKDGGYVCQCPDRHHGSGTRTSPCFTPGQGKLILGLSIGMSSTISFIILYVLYKLFKKRKEIKARKQNFKKNGGLLLTQEISSNEGAIERTRIFGQSELEKATDNFNDNRELGRGGQGTVYKGMLTDGTIVAVKKSKKVDENQLEVDENQLAQFINEVVILSQINHRNIVKLFGCCLETEVPLLVYEFVPNGTLYQHIHHPIEDFHMTWRVRFQIAVECAMAISYLHSSCSSPIYHRDIKSSNILLDEKYKAKISDFGTSRSISIDKTHVTTCVQGTFGYLDPEFFRSSQFSEKSDVYSFGVVLLELLTSKKPIFTNTSGEPRGLATEFIQILETSPNALNGFLDTQVLQHCSKEEIEALTMLIERCLSLSVKQRPTMREVAMTLEMVRKQYDEEGNDPSMQGIRRQEGHGVWTNQINMINGGPCSTSSSAFTDGCHSMDVEPLLFDSI